MELTKGMNYYLKGKECVRGGGAVGGLPWFPGAGVGGVSAMAGEEEHQEEKEGEEGKE